MGRDPALTARIVTLRSDGLSWAQIGARVGISRAAVRERYMKSLHQDTLSLALARAERAEKEKAEVFERFIPVALAAAALADHLKNANRITDARYYDNLVDALEGLGENPFTVSLPDNVAEV